MKRNLHTWFGSPHTGRYDPERVRNFGEMYWRTLLITGAIISLVAVVYALQQFSSIQEKLSSDTADRGPSPQKDIDRAQLQATLDVFRARATRFEALGSSTKVISDPSR